MNHREYARRYNIGLIRTLREEEGITQKQLAEKMGAKQTGIARVETGRQSPTLKFLMRIGKAVGRRAVVVFEREADMRFKSNIPTRYFNASR